MYIIQISTAGIPKISVGIGVGLGLVIDNNSFTHTFAFGHF